jgi:hypothetical protein
MIRLLERWVSRDMKKPRDAGLFHVRPNPYAVPLTLLARSGGGSTGADAKGNAPPRERVASVRRRPILALS